MPAALPGIGAGLLLAWLRAFGEFGATVILAYHPYSLPVFTFVQFDSSGLPATMLPIAAALAAAFAVLLLVALPLPRRRGPRTPPAAAAPADHSSGPLELALAKRLGKGFALELSHRGRSPRLAAARAIWSRQDAHLAPARRAYARAKARHVWWSAREELHELPAERREIGYVPQQPALMPRRHGMATGHVRRARDNLRSRRGGSSVWDCEGLEGRYPEELSGGQQRRVALARALASEPRVLLLDEPFTGLDAPVRDRLRRQLRALQRETGLSTVIVTHDPEEAAMLAEEIIVLSDGRILQAGPREEVFARPRSPEVAGLLGIANTHTGVTVAENRHMQRRHRAGGRDPRPASRERDLMVRAPRAGRARPERTLRGARGRPHGPRRDARAHGLARGDPRARPAHQPQRTVRARSARARERGTRAHHGVA